MTSSRIVWEPDCELGAGFACTTLRFLDDYDGRVTATLVRNDPLIEHARGAILYIHGFIDYFFQSHVAHAFNRERFNFYALDLRKYGRSLDGAVHRNFCFTVEEYFPEITEAIDIIEGEGHTGVILYAHSTGALPATLYAKNGKRCDRIRRMILNSPFLDFKEPRALTRLAAGVGRWLPFGTRRDPVSRWYGRSLHAHYHGEWCFNLDWKPLEGLVAYYGWVRGIVQAHDRIEVGLGLPQPILVMHSDKSSGGAKWSDEFLRSDLVLDVDDIRRLSRQLGANVTRIEIPGGMHDLVLSALDVREGVIATMIEWLGPSSPRETVGDQNE